MIGNLSLRKADFLRVGSLDDDYFGGGGWSGWEDIDFGYRAAQNGLRIRYNPNAVGYHNDYAATDLKACCRRMRIASRVAPILFKKHPGLKDSIAMFHDKGYISWRDDPPNIVLRKLARSIMIRPPARKALEVITGVVEALWPSPALLRPLYRWVIGTYICLGYREGLKAQHG
jgi:GT2 family glycosyltransferase